LILFTVATNAALGNAGCIRGNSADRANSEGSMLAIVDRLAEVRKTVRHAAHSLNTEAKYLRELAELPKLAERKSELERHATALEASAKYLRNTMKQFDEEIIP
jgi:chromosome segregation ATPase